MNIALIICLTLLGITGIICWTIYKLKNNREITKVHERMKDLVKEVGRNNDKLHELWDEVLEYRIAIQELIDKRND